MTFLASEHPTGKTHGGRIDTLAINEDDCPVIIEYKRSTADERERNQARYGAYRLTPTNLLDV